VCLGNTLHSSRGIEEVGLLLQSMDTGDLVSGLQARGGKVEAAAAEILSMLTKGGLELD